MPRWHHGIFAEGERWTGMIAQRPKQLSIFVAAYLPPKSRKGRRAIALVLAQHELGRICSDTRGAESNYLSFVFISSLPTLGQLEKTCRVRVVRRDLYRRLRRVAGTAVMFPDLRWRWHLRSGFPAKRMLRC